MSSMIFSTPIFWVGVDVHKDSVTIAVLGNRDPEPMRIDGRDAIRIAQDFRDGRLVLSAGRYTEGAALRRRQQDQDPSVIAHAWKCQHRLYKIYHRLADKKPKQVAATAVAREMVGFLWAVLNDLDVTQLQQSEVHRTA